MTHEEMRERLAAFLARQVGAEVAVEGLRRLPGGASRETWSLDAVYGPPGAPARVPLVLRRDPGATALASDRHGEFRLLRVLHEAGVPVPHVHWLGDDSLGAPFFLMERVDGETLPRRLLRDAEYAPARAAMTAQLGEILARIHAVDWVRPELGHLVQPGENTAPAVAELDRFEQVYRTVAPEAHPAFELALRWLRARVPPARRLALVHGDYRIGNVIFGPEGVRSILDWELSHIGDPMEDLGWLCVRAWRFGRDHKPVGGIGEREELFAAYARGGGDPVDPAHVRFWEVFGNLKWAIICITQAKTHLDGIVHSIELASLGRRTAETELELLNLIE